MNIGVLELLVGAFALAGLVIWIWALVDALSRPEAQWDRVGQSRLVWILVLIFLSLLGAIIYLMTARPKLENARRDSP